MRYRVAGAVQDVSCVPAEAGAGDPVDPAPVDPAPADPVDPDPADPVAPAPDLGVEFNNSPVEVSFPTLDPLPAPQAVTVRRPTAPTLPPESPELEPVCSRHDDSRVFPYAFPLARVSCDDSSEH